MDANVNIQVSGMNTGHMEKAAWGYMYFILRQIGDWKENAKAVYGMWDALLAPVNTDGNRAIMVEYDIDYPFQYWNAGASWLMVPIFAGATPCRVASSSLQALKATAAQQAAM